MTSRSEGKDASTALRETAFADIRRVPRDSGDFQPAWREAAALASDHLRRMRQTLSRRAEVIAECRAVIDRSRALLDQAAQQDTDAALVHARR